MVSRKDSVLGTAFKELKNQRVSIIKEGSDEKQKHIRPELKKSKFLKP